MSFNYSAVVPGNVSAEVVYLDLPSGPRIELLRYVTPEAVHVPGVDRPNALGLRHLEGYYELVATDFRIVQFLQNPSTVKTGLFGTKEVRRV